jgi:predicted alpha/beta superfamily hydrolase
MRAGWPKRFLKAVVWLTFILALGYAILLARLWMGRQDMQLQSAALGEPRLATIYNGGNGSSSRLMIYSLDGEGVRHGLMPAANGALVAWFNGHKAPMVIAVHTQPNRDVDLRPAKVQQAYWRPDIKGRAASFDMFLLNELRAKVEGRFGKPSTRYLFGHSLGGFYAIDMASRRQDHGFDGLFTFSPTFSHDLSLLKRFATVCNNANRIYANIGLESGRDTDVFGKAEAAFAKIELCQKKVELRRHPGMIHQIVMLTGQIAALNRIYRRS